MLLGNTFSYLLSNHIYSLKCLTRLIGNGVRLQKSATEWWRSHSIHVSQQCVTAVIVIPIHLITRHQGTFLRMLYIIELYYCSLCFRDALIRIKHVKSESITLQEFIFCWTVATYMKRSTTNRFRPSNVRCTSSWINSRTGQYWRHLSVSLFVSTN